MAPQQRAPAERGEGVGQGAHRQQPPRGQVDSVHGGRQLDQVAGALPERGRLGGVAGPVGVEGADLLPAHGGVPRMRLALHPVARGKQFPANARLRGDVAVEVLAVAERSLRGGEIRGRHRGGELGLVPGGGGGVGGGLPLVVDRGGSREPGDGSRALGRVGGRGRGCRCSRSRCSGGGGRRRAARSPRSARPGPVSARRAGAPPLTRPRRWQGRWSARWQATRVREWSPAPRSPAPRPGVRWPGVRRRWCRRRSGGRPPGAWLVAARPPAASRPAVTR